MAEREPAVEAERRRAAGQVPGMERTAMQVPERRASLERPETEAERRASLERRTEQTATPGPGMAPEVKRRVSPGRQETGTEPENSPGMPETEAESSPGQPGTEPEQMPGMHRTAEPKRMPGRQIKER